MRRCFGQKADGIPLRRPKYFIREGHLNAHLNIAVL
jgi:hypothetical protein